MRKNCGGPWTLETPNELGNKPSEEPSMDPGPTLELMPAAATSGGASPPVVELAPALLSSSVDFFFLSTMRERRRWILDSVTLFWATAWRVACELQEELEGRRAYSEARSLSRRRKQ